MKIKLVGRASCFIPDLKNKVVVMDEAFDCPDEIAERLLQQVGRFELVEEKKGGKK